MTHKWEILAGDATMGLIYDEARGRAHLGGLARLRDVLETLAVVGFHRPESVRWVYVQRNKIRHSWSCTWEQVQQGIQRGVEIGYAFQKVTRLGRVMI